MTIKKILSALLCLIICFTWSTESWAKKKKNKITIKIGTVAPEGTPWAEIAQKVKKKIVKKAKKAVQGKKVKVKLYLGGILGGEKSMLRRTKRGQIDVFGGTLGAIATDVPELGAIELPFLFSDPKRSDHVLDNIVIKDIKSLLLKKGYVLMFWSENGFKHLASVSKPLTKVEHLKGMKG